MQLKVRTQECQGEIYQQRLILLVAEKATVETVEIVPMADPQEEALDRVDLVPETKADILQLKEQEQDLLPEQQVVEQPMQVEIIVNQADKDTQ